VLHGRVEEDSGFVGGEGFEDGALAEMDLNLFCDVAGDLVFAVGVGEGGGEDSMEVLQGSGGEEFTAAVTLGTAALLDRGAAGVDVLIAALAGDADCVEPGADVLGGEFAQFLVADAELYSNPSRRRN
jgi:hypothetical protein